MGSMNYNDFQTLVERGIIERKNLKQNQYTVSLLNEGLRNGLLNRQEIYNIQNRLMLVLQNLIKRYTKGESSSVPTETAESLLTSMLYAIDAYFLSLGTPEKAMTSLKTVDIQSSYEKGIETVSTCFEESKQIYKLVKEDKLNVPVDAYNMTINESLPIFMKKYRIIFDAHNTMASIDYPLAIDDMRLQGVFYIKQYLERLYMETKFCQLFSQGDLLNTLESFGRMYKFDYRIELFNIYELMLNSAVFSVLSGGNTGQVKISAYQFKQIERLLTQVTPDRVDIIVGEAIRSLLNDLNISDPRMKDYMNLHRNQMVQRIVNAANSCSLQGLIITQQEERIKPVEFSLNLKDRLSDIKLRKLLVDVTQIDKKDRKAQLIKSNLNSLHDYLDVFESDSLYGDEYEALFVLFGDMELTILAKIVFYEDLRTGFLSFQAMVSEHAGSEEEWKKHFIEYMQRLSPDRLQSIEKLIHMIDYEEINFY
jgi:hypothetical protein